MVGSGLAYQIITISNYCAQYWALALVKTWAGKNLPGFHLGWLSIQIWLRTVYCSCNNYFLSYNSYISVINGYCEIFNRVYFNLCNSHRHVFICYRYQHQFENCVFVCKTCHVNGKEVVVTPEYSGSRETSWFGLAKYAWSGYVIFSLELHTCLLLCFLASFAGAFFIKKKKEMKHSTQRYYDL